MKVDAFDALAADAAVEALLACCASRRWAAAVAGQRPYGSVDALCRAAAEQWATVSEADHLEAFAAHPLIGDVERLRARFEVRAHAEQGQVLAAPEETIRELAALNVAYQARHGFIFIVFATGKSADEMLALLKARIDRDTHNERLTAAEEQAAITDLRLRAAFED